MGCFASKAKHHQKGSPFLSRSFDYIEEDYKQPRSCTRLHYRVAVDYRTYFNKTVQGLSHPARKSLQPPHTNMLSESVDMESSH